MEILYTTEYNDLKYRICKEELPNKIRITANRWKNSIHDYEEICSASYKDKGAEYSSPLLSWYNLIFCSNTWGNGKGICIAPDYEYMNRAVQEGKKTAATIYLASTSDEGKNLIAKLPSDCGFVPYGKTMMFVYHKGKLSDFFDYNRIRKIYENYCSTELDWVYIKALFNEPLDFFGDEACCGFSLQSGGNKEQNLITGLILGYPVESTISYI